MANSPQPGRCLGFPTQPEHVLTHQILCCSGGPSPPPRPIGGDQQNITGIHGVVIFPLFCLCHSLTSFLFLLFFSLLSLSYLLSNKTHAIHSGIWPCLHLNSSRGISKNFHNSVLTKGHLHRGELWLRACCSGLSQSPQLTFQFCQVSKTIYNWATHAEQLS